jgi:hypothetical protein
LAVVKALSFSSYDNQTTKCHPTYQSSESKKEAHVTGNPHENNKRIEKTPPALFLKLFAFPQPFFFNIQVPKMTIGFILFFLLDMCYATCEWK